MNKTLLAILAVVVIAVIGIYAYTSMEGDGTLDSGMTLSSSSSSIADAMTPPSSSTSSADAMTPPSSSSSSSSSAMDAASYTEYREGVIGNGEASVLFFHAAWCPDCRAADTELQQIFSTGLPTMSVYKVDYDSSADLKQKYGVVYQHTFVVIDGEGNATRTLQGATKAQLQALVQ